MRDFRKIKAWQKAHAVVMDIYRAVEGRRCGFTGLRSQLLRAADGMATNIVEGCGRASDAEFLRYLEMSHASARELGYQLMKAEIAALVTPGEYDDFSARTDEVRRMLYGLMRALRRRAGKGEDRSGSAGRGQDTAR